MSENTQEKKKPIISDRDNVVNNDFWFVQHYTITQVEWKNAGEVTDMYVIWKIQRKFAKEFNKMVDVPMETHFKKDHFFWVMKDLFKVMNSKEDNKK